MAALSLSRRRLLVLGAAAGGGLLVGCSAPAPGERLGRPADFPGPAGEVSLNAWLRITPDGRVVVAVPRAEMGQGVHTALAMLVAEELEADWARVSVQTVSAGAPYGNEAVLLNVSPLEDADDSAAAEAVRQALRWSGHALALNITGGSSSLRDAWVPMRWAGATARAQLLQAAARRWGVAVAACHAESGAVVHAASGRRLGFADLASAAASLAPPSAVELKPMAQQRLVGTARKRLDVQDVVRGLHPYGMDVRRPGMLHAAIAHSPALGGHVRAFDTARVLAQPGVRSAFALDEAAVVVVADTAWRAQRALQQVPPAWDDGPHGGLSSEAIAADLRRTAESDAWGVPFRREGDAAAVLGTSGRTLAATYEVPFLAHATLEPQNCTALVEEDQVTLWCPTQVPLLARLQAARVARVRPSRVQLHMTALGGGFGRRLETDVVVEAVRIAARSPGTPVRLAWSRQEDTQHDMYRPAAAARLTAALGADGRPIAWSHRVAAPSVAESFVDRLAGLPVPALPDKMLVEGAFDLPYAIPNIDVRHLRVATPVPVGMWRSVGHSYNAFFTECFLDELAQAAGADPLAYRRALLATRPRHRAVLEKAAALAGWGQPLPAGRARGLALHAAYGSCCAQVAEVSLEGGALRVHRIACVVDCGRLVNPSGAHAQVEGGIAFGLGAALAGEITLAAGRVQQSGLLDVGLLSLARMPQVHVQFESSDRAPQGLGEVAVPPVAPAVANALSALTGRRVRRLPLSRALPAGG